MPNLSTVKLAQALLLLKEQGIPATPEIWAVLEQYPADPANTIDYIRHQKRPGWSWNAAAKQALKPNWRFQAGIYYGTGLERDACQHWHRERRQAVKCADRVISQIKSRSGYYEGLPALALRMAPRVYDTEDWQEIARRPDPNTPPAAIGHWLSLELKAHPATQRVKITPTVIAAGWRHWGYHVRFPLILQRERAERGGSWQAAAKRLLQPPRFRVYGRYIAPPYRIFSTAKALCQHYHRNYAAAIACVQDYLDPNGWDGQTHAGGEQLGNPATNDWMVYERVGSYWNPIYSDHKLGPAIRELARALPDKGYGHPKPD